MATSLRMMVFVVGCARLGLSELVIQLDVGSLRGTKITSDNGETFYEFLGIPYAEAPVGELRFKPPIPKRSWDDEPLDATRHGSVCPQIDFATHEFIGQEDNCLVLNVYSSMFASTSPKGLQPVLVYIHGGGFQFGMGSSEVSKLEKLFNYDDVVVVTLNYRLGPLGFLSTADDNCPGNYGLLDQVEALKWVNRHIKHFGGNASCITLYGPCAGGASVTYHMMSPLSKGLFQRAIALSGSALASWAYQDEPLSWAKKISDKLECLDYSSEDMMTCLRDVPVENLIKSAHSLSVSSSPIHLAPTIDNNFLLDTPQNLLKLGFIEDGLSFMTGVTKVEAEMVYAELLHKRGPMSFSKKKVVKVVPKEIFATILHNYKAANSLFEEYVAYLDMSDVEVGREVAAKFLSEGIAYHQHYATAKLVAKAGIPTYVFKYDYQAPFSFSPHFEQELYGVLNMDDGFILDLGQILDHADFDDKINMQAIYQNRLLTFVKYGNPTLYDFFGNWMPVQPDKLWVYHFDNPTWSDVYNEDSIFLANIVMKVVEKSKTNSMKKAKDEL